MVRPIGTFTVIPSLPPPLERLRELAYNLRWAWNHATIELFRRLDSDLWETSGHNPVLMLGTIDQAQLEAAAADEGFVSHLQGICRYFDAYLAGESTWYRRAHGRAEAPLIAYFSAEFGLTECLSIFAGGLGVLAGDHLKSASDLGVPLVGIGLLYQQGYFRQYLNEADRQQEAYEDNDFPNLPLTPERRPGGAPLVLEVPYPGRQVLAQVWRAQVGRVPLYLLDTNIPANRPEDRDLSDQLYGGDLEMRIKQEILLGLGGSRVLEALGLEPTVYHMNEGHSAFLALERVRRLMQTHGLAFAEAREAASAGLVFTTHTPVPAGHDYFPPDLMDRYFADFARSLGLARRDFLALGRQNPADETEPFCMTVLALRLASHRNAVSRLHGQVTRGMWQGIWPGVPEDEVPLGHVTNGVHFRSWISYEMDQLYDRYLGPSWREHPADQKSWQRVERVPAEELWRTHERRRERLVAFARRRLRTQLVRRGAPPLADRGGGRGAGPGGADHRLRPPLRDVQAGDAPAPGPRAAGADPQPSGPPGAGHLRRQGAPPGRGWEGADPTDRRPGPDADVPPSPDLPGGLRHGGGPLLGPGGRRVAEHPPAAPGGQRDQRHEGGGQRRAEPEHAGWLVGRGLDRGRCEVAPHRVGHRPGGGVTRNPVVSWGAAGRGRWSRSGWRGNENGS